MGKKEKDVSDMLDTLDPNKITSMYKEIGSSESDKNVKVVLDTLKSDKPLPDKVRRDKEIMEVLTQIVETLKPDERMIWKLYYHPENPHLKSKTKEELAEELSTKGWTYGKVRRILDNANLKIRRHNLSEELKFAKFKNEMIKEALITYDFVNVNGEERLVNIYKVSSEDIINDIVETCKH